MVELSLSFITMNLAKDASEYTYPHRDAQLIYLKCMKVLVPGQDCSRRSVFKEVTATGSAGYISEIRLVPSSLYNTFATCLLHG